MGKLQGVVCNKFFFKAGFLISCLITSLPFFLPLVTYNKIFLIYGAFLVMADLITCRELLFNKGRLFLLLFTLFGGVTVLVNLPGMSLSRLSAFAYLFLYYMLLDAYSPRQPQEKTEREQRILLLVFTVFSLIFAAVSLGMYVIQYNKEFTVQGVHRTLGIYDGNRLAGMFGNPGDMGFISLFTLLFLVWGWFLPGFGKKFRIFAVINGVVQVLTLILSLSRGAMVVLLGYTALLAGLLVFGWARKKLSGSGKGRVKARAFQLAKAVGGGVLAVLVLAVAVTGVRKGLSYLPVAYETAKEAVEDWLQIQPAPPPVTEPGDSTTTPDRHPVDLERPQDQGSNGRFELWSMGWKVFVRHPVFGVGFQRGGEVAKEELHLESIYLDINGGFHSVYVELLTAFGAVGFLLFMAYLCYAVGIGVRCLWSAALDKKEFCLMAALFSGVTAYLALGVVDYQLLVPSSVMGTTFWILLGYYLSTVHRIFRRQGWDRPSLLQRLFRDKPLDRSNTMEGYEAMAQTPSLKEQSRDYGFGEQQALMLEMVKVIDGICRRHQIEYTLAGGSALGAVRHQGFIPWDDDMDVQMRRDHYERFKQVAVQELKGTRYFYQDLDTDEGYLLPFSKIRDEETTKMDQLSKDWKMHHGLYVDIFPIDAAPNSKLGRIWQKKAASMIFLAWSDDTNAKPMQRWAVKFLIRLSGGKKKLIRWLIRHSRGYSLEKSRDWGLIDDRNDYATNLCPKDYFQGVVNMPFEDTELPVPAQYDKLLTRFYGDYMTPPSEEQKMAYWHKPYILDLHKSYREYVKHE